MKTVKATTKGVRISPRKVRIVADAIRNMPVKKALASLPLVHKRGADILLKTIKSAVANAVNNAKLSEDELIIQALEVHEGPFLKRYHIGHRGYIRAYKKRSTHVTVVLGEKGEKS